MGAEFGGDLTPYVNNPAPQPQPVYRLSSSPNDGWQSINVDIEREAARGRVVRLMNHIATTVARGPHDSATTMLWFGQLIGMMSNPFADQAQIDKAREQIESIDKAWRARIQA